MDYFDWNQMGTLLFDFIKKEAFSLVIVTGIIFLISRLLSKAAFTYLRLDDHRHSVLKWIRYGTTLSVCLSIFVLYNAHIKHDKPLYLFILGIIITTLALSLRDTFSHFVGWLIIITGKGFKQGDRIKIGAIQGDVIDIGILRTIIAEIGEWVNGDQSTGRLISMPNNLVVSNGIYNFTHGYDYLWDELSLCITFESDWEMAEKILLTIAESDFKEKKDLIQEKLRKLKKQYLLFYNYISPKVYVAIKDSGVELALRYLVHVRKRRTVRDLFVREILKQFNTNPSIQFAYPTIRWYQSSGMVEKNI